MRGRGKLPTWLVRRGYSRRLKGCLAQRALRRRAVLAHAPPVRETAGEWKTGCGPFGGNVLPFPIRPRIAAIA